MRRPLPRGRCSLPWKPIRCAAQHLGSGFPDYGDRTFDEAANFARAGFAPDNNALSTNIAIVPVIHTTTVDNFAS